MKKCTGYAINRITFFEIMIVVVMIGFLTMIENPGVAGSADIKRDAAVKMIRGLESAFDVYRLHNGFYPTTEQGLDALVTKPSIDPLPNRCIEGGYMKRIPIDPWGNSFIYHSHSDDGPIYIISCGPDGKLGTEDDITNCFKELPAGINSIHELANYVPPKPVIIHDVSDDFPEYALSALDSFKRIDRDFFQKRYQSIGIVMGGTIPESPYVYYDGFMSLPSVDNSMFVYGTRRSRRHIISEESLKKTVEDVDFRAIIKEIVGEEDIHYYRQWAFTSYGNFLSFIFSIPRFKPDKSPLSYDKFLMSVFLSLSDIRIGMPDSVYLSFVEEVLLPLSQDLSQRGLGRPPIVINNLFIEKLSRYVRQDQSKLPKWLFPTKYLISSFNFPEPIPHEILWSGIYKKIDHLIGAGYYKDPYYLLKYYKTLPTEGDDAIVWGEALNVDIWCNYYVNSLLAYQYEEKIDEIKNIMSKLRRCNNVF